MRRPVVVLGVLAALAGGVAAERTRHSFDLTAERSLTLAGQSRQVVARVHRPVRVTAFLGPGDRGRAEALGLLSRYRRLNRRIRVRVLDPARSPGEVQRLGVDPLFGGVVLESGRRTERAPSVTEQDVTSGLARLVRGGAARVCVTSGHGEAAAGSDEPAGLSQAATLLAASGYRVETTDLLTAPVLAPGCRAVVVAAPVAPLGPAEAVLASYLAGGGRALVLADPASTVDLGGLLRPYGLGLERGIVVEGDPDARLPGDPLTPVVSRYRSTSPVVRRLPPTLYPAAEAVTVAPGAVPGLAVTALARTSERSYLERRPATPRFDAGEDVPGPVVVGAAADLSANRGGAVRRTRVVVFADVDFATNAFVGRAGNAPLVEHALDWLTLDDDLVPLSAHLPAVRPLDLTEGRLRYLRLMTAGVAPALLLLAGAMVCAYRRTL